MSCVRPRLRWLTVLPVSKEFQWRGLGFPFLVSCTYNSIIANISKISRRNLASKKSLTHLFKSWGEIVAKLQPIFDMAKFFGTFFSKNFSHRWFGVVISELRVQNYCLFLTWPNISATFFELFFVDFSILLISNTIEIRSFFKKSQYSSIFIENGPNQAHSSLDWFFLFWCDFFEQYRCFPFPAPQSA